MQSATGKVGALILPGMDIANSVFSLTEVNVLLRDDVLQKIQINPEPLRNFRILVRAGGDPAPS